LLAMFNQAGKFDRAIEILNERHFHVWEGGGEVHRYFVDAHLLAGVEKMREAEIAAPSVSAGLNAGADAQTGHSRSRLLFLDALRHFEIADTYPDNLEVGRPTGPAGHTAKVFYFMGKAYQGLKDDAKAKECFETVTQSRSRRGDANEQAFFVGMALKELGRQAEADREIATLADAVQRQRESRELIDQYSKFGEDGSRSERVAQLQYLSGLVHLARGEKDKADQEFQTAIKANPDLIWARQFLRTR